MTIKYSSFGQKKAMLISLTNKNQLTLGVSGDGARMVNLLVPVQEEFRNIILGFDSSEEYHTKDSYIGASIGRVAGRIKAAKFTLDNVEYHLDKNDGNNHLHGGFSSFDCQQWDYEVFENESEATVTFTLESTHLDNGFPGNLRQKISYTLTDTNQVKIAYFAMTDKKTIYNPTNHTYFNLNDKLNQEIGKHKLYLDAQYFGVLTDELLPTGELREVLGTPFDFTQSKGQPISQGLTSNYEQNKLVDGYDHPFLFNASPLEQLKGQLFAPDGNVSVKLYTDRPAVVVYTTNMLNAPIPMRDSYQVKHGGITLETQALPDAINQTGFGNIILEPKKPFTSTTIFEIIF